MDTDTYHFEELWLPAAEREPFTVGQPPQLSLVPDPPCDTRAEELTRAHALIGAVARAAVEALTGFRPIGQLTRWLEPSAISGLSLAMRNGAWAGATVAKVRAETADSRVIEGVAQLALTGRHLAIAMRLEQRRGHWMCTDLSVLLPGSHLVSQA